MLRSVFRLPVRLFRAKFTCRLCVRSFRRTNGLLAEQNLELFTCAALRLRRGKVTAILHREVDPRRDGKEQALTLASD